MSTALFNQVVAETNKIHPIPQNYFSQTNAYTVGRPWLMLMDFWSEHKRLFPDVVYMALHYVVWKQYPPRTNYKDFLPLLTPFVTALTMDPSIIESCAKSTLYKQAFSRIRSYMQDRKARCRSMTFAYYMYNRLYCHCLYRDDRQIVFSPEFPTGVELFEDKCVFDDLQKKYRHLGLFEAYIHLLLPDSKDWNNRQWVYERSILRCLSQKYTFDFLDNQEAFDTLLSALMHKVAGSSYIQDIMSLEDIPMGIAQIFWPEDTIANLERIFFDILHKRVGYLHHNVELPYYMTREVIRKSWIYQQLLQLAMSKNGNLSHKTKRAILDFELDINT